MSQEASDPEAQLLQYLAVGLVMALFSLLCLAINLIVLRIIFRDRDLRRLNSYKFMFALGVADCLQLLAHFITGLETVWYSRPMPLWFNRMLGVVATPSYVFYALLTIVLAFNRLISLSSPAWDHFLFSSRGMSCWLGGAALLAFGFSLALASPWASIIYSPDQLSWAYDDQLEFSFLVEYCEMIIEIGGIFVSALLYAAIFTLIIVHKKKYFMPQSKLIAPNPNPKLPQQSSAVASQQKKQQSLLMVELKVLIQAFVITAYCTALNFLWHNSDRLLPHTKVAYCALNFMWIGNGAVNPLIYFLVNVTIRRQVSSTLGAAFSFQKMIHKKLSNNTKAAQPNLQTLENRLAMAAAIAGRNTPMRNNFVDRNSRTIARSA